MQVKASVKEKFLGIYVHVPFCAHKCLFCGFFQKPPLRKNIDTYVDTLIKEIQLQDVPSPADTVYWGGGTPSILLPQHIFRIGECMHIDDNLQEWSVECSPTSVTIEKLSALRSVGVNRITLGIQSFNEKMLSIIGRRQNLKQIYATYDKIRECGFTNVGIDLIFAIPGQSVDDWLIDLKKAVSLSPEHISTYNLTYEGNSTLNRQRLEGKISVINEDSEIDFFVKTEKFLFEHGYNHYEISNFCKPGYESIHNAHTWEMHDWIGYGPSASSQLKNKRFTNMQSLKSWHRGIRDRKPNICEIQNLNENMLVQDSLIFGLRMTKGVNLNVLESRFKSFNPIKYSKFFKKLDSEGFAIFEKNIIKLTTKGLLVANSIGSEILYI